MTYLIKDNTAYFYSRDNVNPNIKGYTVYYHDINKHSLQMVFDKIVSKVVDIPWKFNNPNV